jgi:hypothetical protein
MSFLRLAELEQQSSEIHLQLELKLWRSVSNVNTDTDTDTDTYLTTQLSAMETAKIHTFTVLVERKSTSQWSSITNFEIEHPSLYNSE